MKVPILLFLLGTTFSLHAGDPLKLTNTKGKSIEAEVLALKGGVVSLKLKNGKEVSVPLKKLSEGSQTLVQETLKEQQNLAGETLAPLNEALGHPVFTEIPLWQEDAADVATRLEWPEEAKTPYTSSYRLYPYKQCLFAGTVARTLVAYGDEKGKTESMTIFFSNKGDTLSTVGSGEDHFTDNGKEVSRKTLTGAMRYDEKTISDTLTKVLGKGTFQRIAGQGNKTVKAERWDWNGHSFLLSHAEDEFVSLMIVKPAFADKEGRITEEDRISDQDMRVRLKKNVTQNENGDIYIDHIPMVDQGPKGYCAPATFERAMRHAGVKADMYLLATLATTGGGGTNPDKLFNNVKFTTRSKGGRTTREISLKSLAPKKVKSYIDKGVPVLWMMSSLRLYNKIANERTERRDEETSFSEYAEAIAIEAKSNADKLYNRGNYHICMIVGYNETTGEIAVSDSWGKAYERRWIHHLEAEAVSQEAGYVIDL